jgi:hypothetical protein
MVGLTEDREALISSSVSICCDMLLWLKYVKKIQFYVGDVVGKGRNRVMTFSNTHRYSLISYPDLTNDTFFFLPRLVHPSLGTLVVPQSQKVTILMLNLVQTLNQHSALQPRTSGLKQSSCLRLLSS